MKTKTNPKGTSVRETMRSVRCAACSVTVAAALVIGLTDTAYAIGPAGSTWLPRELVSSGVDSQDHNGADRLLAFDHHGNPGVMLKKSGNFGDINYARKLPGFGWAVEDIFPSINVNGRGPYPSLAYDRHERPAVSFIGGDPNVLDATLRFSHFDGQDWQHQIADSIASQDVGSWTSLSFDHTGRAAIAYNDITNARLEFIHDTDGDFDFTDESPITIDVFAANEEATHVSLAFDPLNRPMVSYVTERGELMFGVRETLGWLTRTIDISPLGSEIASSLAIDPDTGYPAIAYSSFFLNASLNYAEWDGNDWVTATVDAVGSTGFHPSLAFDPTDGNPAIAYHDASGGNLKIAWHDGAIWRDDTVDNVGTVGINPSIAFREFGTGDKVAAITYHDDAGNLWYIEDPPPAVPEPSAIVLMLTGCGSLLRRSGRHHPSHIR